MYCEGLLFVNHLSDRYLHPCVFGMWWWLDLLSKALRPPDILWYMVHIILLFVCFPLCKLQQTKHISLLPFCVWKEKGKCFLCGKSSYLGHPPPSKSPCKKSFGGIVCTDIWLFNFKTSSLGSLDFSILTDVVGHSMYDFHDSTDTLKFWTEKWAINKTYLFFICIWWNLSKL